MFGSGCGTMARGAREDGRTGAGVGFAVTVLSTFVDYPRVDGNQRR